MKRGRQKKKAADRKTEHILVRVTLGKKKEAAAIAKKCGVKLATWSAQVLLSAIAAEKEAAALRDN